MHASLRSCFATLAGFLRPLESTPIHTLSPSRQPLSTSTAAVARSIRNAVANGQVDHGYQLFTKFYTYEYGNAATSTSNGRNTRPASSYLAHVLIHALHRSQKPLSAASVTKMCMERGVKIRMPTFIVIFSGISPPCDAYVRTPKPMHTSQPPPIHSVNTAIGLLRAARKSGHRHRPWMYDRLINALLLQGEVLTATALFITLFKEWNARRHAKEVEAPRSLEETSQETDIAPPVTAKESTRSIFGAHPVQLRAVWMQRITDALEEEISRPEGSSLKRRTVRALIALVRLLEGDHQDVPQRWRLFRLLRLALSADCLDEDTSGRFRRVLVEFCQRPEKRTGLDLLSYHALLHYAFRGERSINLGTNVLRALVESYDPTLVTYNILMRGISDLGEFGTAEAVARLLNVRNGFAMAPLAVTKKMPARKGIIDCLSSRPIPFLDGYSIVAMMTQAIARGDPQAACKFTLQVFPQLDGPYPRLRRHRLSVMERARRFSPHFWATAQRAAAMANQVRLSMNIWDFVMQAEKSHNCAQIGDAIPRLYNVVAYTVQLLFFSTKLQSICHEMQKFPGDGMDWAIRERTQTLFTRYKRLLMHIERVLLSLQERSFGGYPREERTIGRLELDEKLIKVLFALAEGIIAIEQQRLPAFTHQSTGSWQRDPWPDEYNDLGRPRRSRKIVGVVRRMMLYHELAHPGQLKSLGLERHDDRSLPSPKKQKIFHQILPKPRTLDLHRRKQRTFKMKYSKAPPGLQKQVENREEKPRVRLRADKGSSIRSAATKPLVRMLEFAQKAAAKTPG